MALSKIKTGSIADDAVTSTKIATGGIATLDMADGSVTSLKIADGAIGTADLADSAVTTVKLNDAAVTTAKINDTAITTAKILDGNVTSAKLASDSVTTAKIVDGNVTSAKLASDSVTTAKILDGNVTAGKLASGAVTSAKLASGAAVDNIGYTPQRRVYINPRTRHNTWARVFHMSISSLYAAAIVNISHTRDSVVCGATMFISGGHSGGARITQIEGHYYSTVKVGLENDGNNNFFFCIYDNAYRSGAYGSQTDFDWEVSVIPLIGNVDAIYQGTFTPITDTSMRAELQLGNSYYTSNGTSDIRYKQNIQPIENALAKVLSLNGCTFDLNGERDAGLIAQDMLNVQPELVTGLPPKTMVGEELQRYMDSGSYILGIKYGNTSGLLVEAIKEQQGIIDDLKAKVDAQADIIAQLQAK